MYAKGEAYQKIEELTIRFGEQITSYKNAAYNETLVRRDFLDLFFKGLGWDVDTSQGYAEAYREVIHEDKIKIGSATKAPDYSNLASLSSYNSFSKHSYYCMQSKALYEKISTSNSHRIIFLSIYKKSGPGQRAGFPCIG